MLVVCYNTDFQHWAYLYRRTLQQSFSVTRNGSAFFCEALTGGWRLGAEDTFTLEWRHTCHFLQETGINSQCCRKDQTYQRDFNIHYPYFILPHPQCCMNSLGMESFAAAPPPKTTTIHQDLSHPEFRDLYPKNPSAQKSFSTHTWGHVAMFSAAIAEEENGWDLLTSMGTTRYGRIGRVFESHHVQRLINREITNLTTTCDSHGAW